MKVLIVCSGNVNNFDLRLHQPFVIEQIEAIKKESGIDYGFYIIRGKGVIGYLANYFPLVKTIKNGNYNIIHAHFGLSGVLSVIQRVVPTVVTFHGSDFNNKRTRLFSLFARKFSQASIFVSKKMTINLTLNKNDFIIPCGLDMNKFYPIKKDVARAKLNLSASKRYILFSSHFDNRVKNYNLAQNIVNSLTLDVELIELKNKTREEVNLLLNAVDLLILTSFSEGSPQIIKEAMACNCPILSTDVGDVKAVISDTSNCKVSNYDQDELVDASLTILKRSERSNGRAKIEHLDNRIIAQKIMKVYSEVLGNS